MLSRPYSAFSSKKKEEEDREEIFCSEEEEETEDLLHCITCGENFKCMKELVKHEALKKHKEKVALIAYQLNDVKLDVEDESNDNRIKIEDGMNSSANPLFIELDGLCMHSSISSVSLPDDNTLKALEIISELDYENDIFEEPKLNGSSDNRQQPLTDSLLYTKLREMKNRRCSLPVREKNKNPTYSKFKDEDEYQEDTISETLLTNDSFTLTKKKSRKQELKESVEGRRMKTSISDGHIQTAIGKSSITDSLKILKKRTASEGGKIRRKLFGKGAGSSGTCNDS